MLKQIGYHGTSVRSAKNIIKIGFFHSDEKSWFGKGVYFYCSNHKTDGCIEAKNWVIKVKKFSEWAVIESLIEASEGQYIDLLRNKDHRKAFTDLQNKFGSIIESIQSGSFKGDKKLIELLQDKIDTQKVDIALLYFLQKELGTTIEVFILPCDGKQFAYPSQIIVRYQIQLFVRDVSHIKSRKVVLESN